MSPERVDRSIKWTPERIEISARAALMVKQVRSGNLTGDEALLLVIFPPDNERLDALVAEHAATLGLDKPTPEPGPKSSARSRALTPEERRIRERLRYRDDPEYHARRIASFRARRATPEFREKERARMRARRAKAKGEE